MMLLLQLPALLLILLLAAMARKFRQQRDALMEQQRRALDDEGLLAQLEVAEAAGSTLAGRLLATGRTAHLLSSGGEKTRRIITATTPDFKADFDSCSDPSERLSVIARWHRHGFVFDSAMRRWLLTACDNIDRRNAYRRMFDEQDGYETKK